MSSFGFSAKHAGFYLLDWRDDFDLSGTLPDDLIAVSDDIHATYTSLPPHGMTLGADDNGMPVWVTEPDRPPLSKDEAIKNAELKKNVDLAYAKQHISIWQTQLQLGMISETDKASLIAWMNYITALQAVDTSFAPDIDWPTQPDA